MRRLYLSLLVLLFPLLACAEELTAMQGMLIQPTPNATKLIFILTKKTSGKVKYQPNPNRVLIEFANTKKNFDMHNSRLGGSFVTSIDTENVGQNNIRFILRVMSKPKWTVNFLPPEKNSGVRLQIIVSAEKPQAHLQKKHTEHEPALAQVFHDDVVRTLSEEQFATQSRLARAVTTAIRPRIFKIIVDAGHGGKDTGAIGATGVREKNVVLHIAKKLVDEINQHPNMRAILTRKGDYFVPLRERLKLARKGDGDIFVAIHADAYFEKKATGASVYALSEHGATNEAARWLAQKDNYSELDNIELDALKDRSKMVRSVLIDLAQTATIQDSVRLGGIVLDELDNVSSLHHSQVEQAPFVVLKSPDIPSILVETGFITNRYEEKRLANPEYQNKIAHALCVGINKYVKRYAMKE